MYIAIVIIHVIASIFLIAVILLQAGRGGGLADSFGGSQMQNMFGTQSKNVLTKLTTVCAVLFIITCLSLAIVSSRRSKSLVDKINVPISVKQEQQEPVIPIQEDVEEKATEPAE